MTRIRRTLRTISLLVAVVGVTSQASGQQKDKPTNPSPPTRHSAPPPHPQASYKPSAKTPPAANSSQSTERRPPASAPNASPSYVSHTPTAATGKAGTNNSVWKDPGHVEVTTPSVHNPSPSYHPAASKSVTETNNNAMVTGHPSAVNSKITPPMRPAYALPANSASAKKLGAPAALDSSASKSVVQQVNTARSSMSGINSRRLPQGKVLVHPNGALTIEGAGGRQYHVRKDGTVAAFEANGMKTSFRPDGTLSAIHTSNMHINYAVSGARRVETVRPDHSVLVSTGPHQGYLQRTVVVNNRTVVQRIYVVNKTTYVHNYTTYTYRGVVLEHYVPAVYYAPAFYGWVYYPWPHPVSYRWAFYADPWYGYYGAYFTPAPVYPTPALWLTDYLLAQTLSNAYQDRPATVARQGDNFAQADTAISPETKQMLGAEVQEMVAAGNNAAQDPSPESDQSNLAGELPDVVKHERSVFVVASNLDVTNENGECGLTAGDILEMDAPLPQDAVTADVRVISSKRIDCPASSLVRVSVDQLQEMHNNLRQRVDEGMQLLRASQGSSGIPVAPPEALAPPPRPNYMVDAAPVSEEQVVTMIAEQQQTADVTPQVIQDEFGG